ncbi:MAG: DUF927 domain-containing protein [Clostridia bacterium]|nr:DUF927 domain-containing protein [Clostridia bacterium]
MFVNNSHAIATSAGIEDGYYGYWKIVKKKDTDDETVFVSLGKAVYVQSVTSNIETESVTLHLQFNYLGEEKVIKVNRKNLVGYELIQELSDAGADVSKKNFDIFVDTLRLQEQDMEANGQGSQKVYEHLGWKTMKVKDAQTGLFKKVLCYRASEMLGDYTARYVGNLKVTPMGSFETWKSMVLQQVIGHIPLEIVLLAALSAVVNGLISSATTHENPIVHLCGTTGTGKSTGAFLAASTAGEPFDGEIHTTDENGMAVKWQSVYGSWSATENAVVGSCAGNRGSVIILNELGKLECKDATRIIYNLSEGTDKKRKDANMQEYIAEGYSTTIISVGEHSLLDRCKTQDDGLKIRVLELNNPMTSSAQHADNIKAVCCKHNGHAAPMLAEFILNNGGMKHVLSIYKSYREGLSDIWIDTPSKERFIAKFVALFLTTADLAELALGVSFSKDAIIDFFLEYEGKHGQKRNSGMASYQKVIEECRKNYKKFHDLSQEPSSHECWGRVCRRKKVLSTGRVIVGEILVYPSVVEKILKDDGYTKETCVNAWKKEGLISCDSDRPTRSRKIASGDPTEDVFVFNVFDDEANLDFTSQESGGANNENVKSA